VSLFQRVTGRRRTCSRGAACVRGALLAPNSAGAILPDVVYRQVSSVSTRLGGAGAELMVEQQAIVPSVLELSCWRWKGWESSTAASA